MDRILATLVLLAALVLGCDVTDPNDTDTDDTGDTTPEVYEASFKAFINTYGWDGDAVVLLDSSELDKTIHGNGASFIASAEGETTVTGTTPDLLELNAGIWNAAYIYADYPIPYVGWTSADLSSSSDLGASLCVDLSGDWSCDDGMHPDPIETEGVVMNDCSVQFANITGFGNAWLEIDGNKVESTLGDGTTIRGIITTDTITMIVDLWNDITVEAVCDRMQPAGRRDYEAPALSRERGRSAFNKQPPLTPP